MKHKPAAPSLEDAGLLIALLAALFGGWMRLMPPLLAGFPINDGGLFYAMMGALRANSYRIPQFIHYNGLDIPFAYPPLAFYLGAGLADLFRMDDLVILQWMPAVVLILTIPAFFLLAESVTRSRFQAGIATLFFALIPRSILWLIMGGGLTRSLGQLFLILAARQLYILFTQHTRRSLVWAGVFCTLIVLTHPEASLHAAGMAILFWAFLSRDRRGTLEALAVAGIVLAGSAAWWIPALLSHGISPWLAASRTGLGSYFNFLSALLPAFTAEPLMTIVGVLGLIGIAVSLARRQFLLPVWVVMHFIMEGRNAPNVAILPLCILAAMAVVEVILPALRRQEDGSTPPVEERRLGVPAFMLLLFVGLYLLGAMAHSGSELATRRLSPSSREAFSWIRTHTPAGSHFLVLTGEMDLFADPVVEWFPALTRRTGITTIQGREWLDHKYFKILTAEIQQLISCSSGGPALACMQQFSEETGQQYDYVYTTRGLAAARPLGGVISELDQESNGYREAFRNADAIIYEKLP